MHITGECRLLRAVTSNAQEKVTWNDDADRARGRGPLPAPAAARVGGVRQRALQPHGHGVLALEPDVGRTMAAQELLVGALGFSCGLWLWSLM